jgi:hypothetical protein
MSLQWVPKTFEQKSSTRSEGQICAEEKVVIFDYKQG